MIRTIVITGAASGIGEALSLRYAQDGARLGLIDIDRDKLEQIMERCRSLGAEVRAGVVDVRVRSAVATWLEDFDRSTPVDILIANAGVLCGVAPGESTEPADDSLELIDTNVLGVFNTVHPLLPRMLERKRGHIALMSSAAGLVPLQQMPSYGASKAAVYSYGLSLRAGLRASGVQVSVICPGYVRTPLTSRIVGPLPFIQSAKTAADRIVAGIDRNAAIIAFPWYFVLAMRWGGYLSDGARRCVFSALKFGVARKPV